MRSIILVSSFIFVSGVLSSCYTPHAPEDLPAYNSGSPAIDNDDWSGTLNQAEWKEHPGLNDDLLHQAITGKHLH